MKIVLRLLAAVAALAVLAGIAGALAWRSIHRPYSAWAGAEVTVEVRQGAPAAAILRQLEDEGVIRSALLGRVYLTWVLDEPPLKAGEYRFDRPAALPEVLAKLSRGEVETHPVTVVEGLTLEETAHALADAGFGRLEHFLEEMADKARIADLDPAASDLEGYLFPDTYQFARGTAEDEIVDAMVRTYRRRAAELAALADEPADHRRLVTLASVIEKEAGLDAERPVIAGVFTNRLRRGMPLQADPTVIYALKREGRWDGNLRRDDLQLDSPYNTYRYRGLPPGPICSPGLESLRAAAAPAEVPYFYFVSRNDGSHVFAATLAEHNRNVERWQRQYWRQRWAEEKRTQGGG